MLLSVDTPSDMSFLVAVLTQSHMLKKNGIRICARGNGVSSNRQDRSRKPEGLNRDKAYATAEDLKANPDSLRISSCAEEFTKASLARKLRLARIAPEDAKDLWYFTHI